MDCYSWNSCDKLIYTPHALIAGTTGSGKSVFLNSCIFSIMAQGGKMVMIDLKRVELSRYKDTLNCIQFVSEPEDVCPALDKVIDEMEYRFIAMERRNGLETTEGHIFVVIDELAVTINTEDTKYNKSVLSRLTKIGRLGRAAHIHLLCATQDPSRKTLPAALMQNFTCTVALRCKSSIESRQIIGVAGAEKLPKYGEGIRWDADGVKKFEVPMTPKGDIDAMVEHYTRKPVVKKGWLTRWLTKDTY